MKVRKAKNTAFLVLAILSVAKPLVAQETIKHKPSLTIGISALKFTGDVGKETDVNPLIDTRLGYYLCLEQRFGKVLGISLGGLYGKLAGTNNTNGNYLNFQSTITQGELLLTANFDKVLKNDPTISPFINAGVGYMMFDPKGDLKNGSNTYYYWKDGSIRNEAETVANQLTAQIIKRDYTYESTLKDSSSNYTRAGLIVPFGGGINFHIGERWTSSIGVNYVMVFSDYVDNHKNGGNDSYLQANVGIQFEFKKKTKSASDEVDFYVVDHLDTDNDGVSDDKDRCLGTPKGILVDTKGCPFDADNDGVPDYMDKEPKSKKGAKVDGYGVTINEEELAKHQLEWDTIAVEKSEGFNEAPSLSYLEEVEKEGVNKEKKQIPSELATADINKDGFISASEITQTIDAFFEGINEFTVEGINRLIDYFFEQ